MQQTTATLMGRIMSYVSQTRMRRHVNPSGIYVPYFCTKVINNNYGNENFHPDYFVCRGDFLSDPVHTADGIDRNNSPDHCAAYLRHMVKPQRQINTFARALGVARTRFTF
jgi:hypothetical protein